MALITDLGGLTSNSYNTQTEIEAYFTGHPYAAGWTYNEGRAIYATTLLDSLVAWFGYKWDYRQAREFPRAVYMNTEDRLALGFEIPVLPVEIKNAQCELDLYIFKNSTSLLPSNNLDSVKVGPLEVNFNQDAPGGQELLPAIVQGMVKKWGTVKRSGNGATISNVVRG